MSARHELVPPISLLAGSDLSASQFCLAVLSSGQLALPSAGGRVTGVMLTKADAAGEPISVGVFGPQPVKAGGSFTAGAVLKATAAGKVVSASADDIAAGSGVAVALEDSGGDGEVVECLMLQGATGTTVVTGLEVIAAPGALSVNTEISELDIDGTDAFTLADGLYVGQQKLLRVVDADNTPVGTVTPATTAAGAPTAYVFDAVGQEALLEWASDGWKIVGGKTAGADAPAAASTLRRFIQTHVLSIDGTDDWILEDGLWPGQVKNFIVAAAINTPAGTVSGLFYDNADGSADGTDLTLNAAADAGFVVWDGVRWFPVGLVSATT